MAEGLLSHAWPVPSKNLSLTLFRFTAGSASGFDGNDLIRESGRGVVVVILQYRLGLLGFLSSSRIKANGTPNAGLLDQQFALQWVQKNIHLFGGDKNHVVLWGESAGAGSIMQHIVANGGNTSPPLFKVAMTSSIAQPPQYNFDDVIPETMFSQVVNQTGCASAADQLVCLRTVSADTLQNANIAISLTAFFGIFNFLPVVDGSFVRDRPSAALREKRVNGDAVLSVVNTNEGALFVDPRIATTVQTPTYLHNLFPALSPAQISEAAALYAPVGTPFVQAQTIMTEVIFWCPTYFLLQGFSKKTAFKGQFAVPPALHGGDVAYYFPTLSGPPPFNNTAFDTAFPQSFLDFARFSDPNEKFSPTITPHWRPWTLEDQTEIIFNRTTAGMADIHPITTSKDVLTRCNFWERIGASVPQ